MFSRFLKNESGATAIEYGLIAALVAVAIIGALKLLGGDLTNTFNAVADNLTNASRSDVSRHRDTKAAPVLPGAAFRWPACSGTRMHLRAAALEA
jgi:pilus assembly protein Flp/PilA